MTDDYEIHLGDCIPHMLEVMPESSVDFAVFSPPFPAMYAYTDSECDLGNVPDLGNESEMQFRFFFNALERVMKPGRVAIVHCCQIPRMKRCGGVGMHDFRGMLIRLGERAGLIYEYDWLIPKNPQSQAIRTRSRELQFSGLEKDRAASRGSIPDYLIKFRKSGENATPIQGGVSRNEWIEWAEAAWLGIRETDTLNVRGTKGKDDTKHICPLQLGVIRRLIRMYTNEGELVFSPFTGIGSEGYEAVGLKRRFYGCELKEEYYRQALRNIEKKKAEAKAQPELFA